MTDRKLTSDEAKAWDRVRQSVRPLKGGKSPRIKRDVSDHPILKKVKPPSATAAAKPQTGSRRAVDGAGASSGPADRSKEKKVRRGKLEISASFDLHGHTQDTAWSALPAFLIREQARGSRSVIVITGKGKAGEGILRRNFLRWIEMPEANALVSGYAPAHPRHGGAGAFYVFLRRR